MSAVPAPGARTGSHRRTADRSGHRQPRQDAGARTAPHPAARLAGLAESPPGDPLPLGLFTAWAYLQPDMRCLVYPRQSPPPAGSQCRGKRRHTARCRRAGRFRRFPPPATGRLAAPCGLEGQCPR
jgi:hypothetical protein